MSVIEINNLSKYYGKSRGIEDISLSVEAGEIYGFVGKNGAGKSTTIRILLNMIFPTCGSASILGLDSIKDTKQIKKYLSYVPSEVSYYPSMKVNDLLKYSMTLNEQTANKELSDKLCEYFELDKTRLIRELSLGNRKKVSIVQALLKNPKVMILDEPASGLDPLIQEKLFKKLQQERDKGVCIFLSSHNLDEVQRYCDRVCVIKDGKVVEIENMSHIKEQSKLRVSYTLASGEQKIFDCESTVNELIKNLSLLDITSLEIRYQTLEEEFMKYYKEDANNE